MAKENLEYAQNEFKKRASTLRTRTWTLTIALVLCIVLYCLLQIFLYQSIDWVTLIIIGTIQIVIHCLYFPDGDIFGQQDPNFIANKTAYNDKANEINAKHKLDKLRVYCKIEFEERKKRYIESELSKINITQEEFNELKSKSSKEIKRLTQYEFKNNYGSKLVFFTKNKRKILYNLIFKALPIKENHPETIMSAVENNGYSAIKDGSISYKTRSYIKIILKATVVAVFCAYISLQLKNSLSIESVIEMFFYLTALFVTAIFAFTSGEKCSKVYKSIFYIELSNFIDNFNEWYENNNKLKEGN